MIRIATRLTLACVLALAGIIVWSALWASPRVRLYHPPLDRIVLPADPDALARGGHLVAAVAVCTVCHGENLAGKLAFKDDFLGQGYTANLTAGRGGVGAHYTDSDWVRAIRYGVRPDSTGILFMPSDYFNAITDADLGAMIAFLKVLPPVDNERTHVEINLLPRLLIDTGVLGGMVRAAMIDMTAPRRPPPADPGAYLVKLGGCTFCHGADLRGGQGPEPGAPAGQDLTVSGPMAAWSQADFIATMRSGVTPDQHTIAGKYMPWMGYRGMTDGELASIWSYLRLLDTPEGRKPA